MIGNFVCTLAGHDKGEIYVVIDEDAKSVTLADGRIRTVERPKIKNKKHIQIIDKNCDVALKDKILSSDRDKNEVIKRAIKLYKREEENVKG